MAEDDSETAEVHTKVHLEKLVKSKTSVPGSLLANLNGDPQYETLLNQAVTTLPSSQTLSSLALDIQPNQDQVTVSWAVPAEIS